MIWSPCGSNAVARGGPGEAMPGSALKLSIVLNAAIVAVVDDHPCILRVPGDAPSHADALPWGPFDPLAHRTMEIGLRRWVEAKLARIPPIVASKGPNCICWWINAGCR